MKAEKKVNIRFAFNVKKFVNAMALFAQEVNKLDKLKAAKLLYFADKHHLVRYGRPIFGDRYHSLDYGPVPSLCLDIMNEVLQPLDEISMRTPYKNIFERKLKVSKPKDHPYPCFKKVEDPDMEVFSQSEIESLKATIAKYGKKTGGKLIDLCHKEATWLKTRGSENPDPEIDYRLFFKNSPEAEPGVLELMEASQEDRDFIKHLQNET